jgi:hypothetical protein
MASSFKRKTGEGKMSNEGCGFSRRNTLEYCGDLKMQMF